MGKKLYQDPDFYEKKLPRVMERLGVTQYEFNWDRWSAWVQFFYKSKVYRFEHSIEKSKKRAELNKRSKPLEYGSDCFAKIVLSLEKLTKMVEDDIYDLDTWVAGLNYLPPATEIPECFKFLGFNEIPKDEKLILERYRELVKKLHPDVGGDPEFFIHVTNAKNAALAYLKENKRGE